MQYLLQCASCQAQHTVTASQSGSSFTCDCGADVAVPTLRGLKELPVAGDQPTEIEISDAKKSVWLGWRGPTIAFAATGFVIAGAYTCWFLLQLLMLDTSHTAEREIAASNQLFDQYAPEDLSLVWASYAEVGVKEKSVPDFEILRRYALARKYLAMINGSVAAICASIATVVWISASRAKKRLSRAAVD